jgi:hypothetical protein
MNLNLSVKYQLHDSKKPLVVFYSVLFLSTLIIILLTGFSKNSVVSVKGSLQGLEMASAVFLFVAGLTSFREIFRLFVQNGVSRKALFLGRLITVACISMGMSLIDNMAARFFRAILPAGGRLEYMSLFEMLYGSRYASRSSGFLRLFEGILLMFTIYVGLSMIGYFITTLYYRMQKGTKIAVSIGVPAFLFILLPMVDSYVFGGALGRAIEKFLLFAFGFLNGANPYYAMVTMLLIFAVFSGLSWLLVRKAVVKD